ncbi:MAG: glycosyltransferase [Bernardetiaceae bacterium]
MHPTPKNALLIEIAWEVCNQVGGIHTVIRTKAPVIRKSWGENYCLIGPYVHKQVSAIFEPIHDQSSIFAQAAQRMREAGYQVYFGHWLIPGRPFVILFDLQQVWGRLPHIKGKLWEDHQISSPARYELTDQVIAFGELIRIYLEHFSVLVQQSQQQAIVHFHEWLASTALPQVRRLNLPLRTVFTTHATSLGRYLAMNDDNFYEAMPYYDWYAESKRFGIDCQVLIERAAAHGAHVFTTVSDVTAKECEYLLGVKPDVVLPNGLNIDRFTALHEFQNLHMDYKEKIHQFVMGHFFHSYKFDLDKTLYFFTSGRYEYRNKGYDLTLEALARLNYRLRQMGSDMTVVMFMITKQSYDNILPQVLESRAVMEEIRQNCDEITNQIKRRLFYAVAAGQSNVLPDLNELVDEYWKLRLRRTLQSWQTDALPAIVTHKLRNDYTDDVLRFLRSSSLVNRPEDRVKIIYHPDFIAPTSPLFGMDYSQFVRGCHLGIFPSYYEPWGYTPPECIASGVPAVTSDLSGFGDYITRAMPDHLERGMYIVNRKHGDFDRSANQLVNQLMNFIKQTRRERIAQRNKVESSSVYLDWTNLILHYEKAYRLALQ